MSYPKFVGGCVFLSLCLTLMKQIKYLHFYMDQLQKAIFIWDYNSVHARCSRGLQPIQPFTRSNFKCIPLGLYDMKTITKEDHPKPGRLDVTKDNSKDNLIHIGDILKSALGKYRPAQDMEMTRIWKLWDTAVGAPIAMNAKPDAFKDGILMVNVSSSAWIHQLKFLEKDMVDNLNKHLDAPLIKQIRFKIGKIHS